MADNTSCTLPRELRAGDSASWRRELTDYPVADGWALAYTLVGAAGVQSFTAAPDGAGFLVQLTAAATAGWIAGACQLVEYVTKGAERHTIGSTPLRILPDLAAATVGVDTRSHAQKVLDIIDAWMESKSVTAGEYQMGERRIRQYGLEELLAMRDQFAAIVANEQNGGKGLVRRMLVQL